MNDDRINSKSHSYWSGTPSQNRQGGPMPASLGGKSDPLKARENQYQNETGRERAYVVDMDNKMPNVSFESNRAQGATTTDGFRGYRGVRDQREDMDLGAENQNLHDKFLK